MSQEQHTGSISPFSAATLSQGGLPSSQARTQLLMGPLLKAAMFLSGKAVGRPVSRSPHHRERIEMNHPQYSTDQTGCQA